MSRLSELVEAYERERRRLDKYHARYQALTQRIAEARKAITTCLSEEWDASNVDRHGAAYDFIETVKGGTVAYDAVSEKASLFMTSSQCMSLPTFCVYESYSRFHVLLPRQINARAWLAGHGFYVQTDDRI